MMRNKADVADENMQQSISLQQRRSLPEASDIQDRPKLKAVRSQPQSDHLALAGRPAAT